MIEFKNLNKRFGRLHVLKDIDLHFEDGACVIFIGPNGCGKTTLIKCLLHMVVPSSGTVWIDGKDVSLHPESRSNLGFMPQIGSFPEHMTVKEVINAVQSIRNYKEEIDKDIYNAYDIPSLGAKKMNTLSGGTVQKVSAAIAFMFHPDIIIMDEPFAGLDIQASHILRKKIIKEREKGKTIFITSHILGDIDELISNVVFMDNGSVLFNKSLSQLYAETGEQNISEAVLQLIK